ncbi:MAG: ATP-binding cassette domain-containing protein [Coriobacteriales bacterium]|jgi:NitT/TauT family transport system permease protein|nr:ATP-binding cassette domain-containing protein [Coriobacteriales bacterium]
MVLAWLLVWQLASTIVAQPLLLAGPLDVVLALGDMLPAPGFWSVVGHSFARIAVGFLAALFCGIVFGIAAWRLPVLALFLNPALTFVKSVPIVCFIVLLLIWLGSGAVSAAAVFLVAFPALYFAVLEGMAQRRAGLGEMLRVFSLPAPRRLLAFSVPSLVPFVRSASKVAVGMSWKSGVAAELIGTPLGSIGERVYQTKLLLSSSELLAWTLVIVAASLVCEKAFLAVLDKVGDWSFRLALPRRVHAIVPCATHDVTADGLVMCYGVNTVLDGLALRLAAGGRYALHDPSGTGKTTLLSLLAGLAMPQAGEVRGVGRASMVFQEARLFEGRSALDNLQLVAGEGRSREDLAGLLALLLPRDSLDRPVSELSGGQRRRVEICRALAATSGLVLLDEPFAGLDDAARAAAVAFVLAHLDGRTLVIATHDAGDAAALNAAPLSLAPASTALCV